MISKGGIYTAVIKIDKHTAMTDAWTTVVTTGPHSPSVTCDRVKLPKLVLWRYITNRTTFWESFKSSVNGNWELSDIDKFNYLNPPVTGTAQEAVSGLSLTSANYTVAVTILKKRFGEHIKAGNVNECRSHKFLKRFEGLHKLHDILLSLTLEVLVHWVLTLVPMEVYFLQCCWTSCRLNYTAYYKQKTMRNGVELD